MNFICDVHIPLKLVKFLNDKGAQTIHVNSLPNSCHSKDIEIATFADLHQMIVITKDEDFERLHFAKNKPQKLIRVLLGNVSTDNLLMLFDKYFDTLTTIDALPKFYLQIANNGLILTKDYNI